MFQLVHQQQWTKLCFVAWLCLNILEGITEAAVERLHQNTPFPLVDLTPNETLGWFSRPENIRMPGVSSFIAQLAAVHCFEYFEQRVLYRKNIFGYWLELLIVF